MAQFIYNMTFLPSSIFGGIKKKKKEANIESKQKHFFSDANTKIYFKIPVYVKCKLEALRVTAGDVDVNIDMCYSSCTLPVCVFIMSSAVKV